MGRLTVIILQQGSIAFIGCKLIKSLGQREISEIIAASGWSIVGVGLLNYAIIPLIMWVRSTVDLIKIIADKIPFM